MPDDTEPRSSGITDWIARYRAAWESNEPDDIRALFTPDADYRTEPYSPAWHGHDEIVDGWLAAQDAPASTTFSWQILRAPDAYLPDDIAMVQATTVYVDGPTYSNLWLVRLAPDDRASEFTEWWMEQPDAEPQGRSE
ncbi:nuclear transport factor 2 family protein [Subtercola boreus]|uniref:nuclear transport factor 2 family protein n=1 Tax=Subtercola boreus TaxID=120213 RepID=UPI001559DEAB|nr:nuclear transport factor 2 family protein [Subtercola boreus]